VAVGITGTAESLLYVINPAANYPVNATNSIIDPLTNGVVQLSNLPPGRYRSFWYDPKSAALLAQSVGTSDGTNFALPLPVFREDIAGRLIRDFQLGPLRPADAVSVSIALSGEIGHTFRLEGSTNLRDWSPIASTVNTNGVVNWVDREAANYSARFYRAAEQN
jgi:hypothetical protein